MWWSCTTTTTFPCPKSRRTRASPARVCRDSIKRAEAQLLEMEERLGLAKRFREMRDGFEAIRAAAQDIQEYNDRYGYSREIDERAKRILTLSDHLSRA